MDTFQIHQQYGPGGPKCACCVQHPTKQSAHQRARAVLKRDTKKQVDDAAKGDE